MLHIDVDKKIKLVYLNIRDSNLKVDGLNSWTRPFFCNNIYISLFESKSFFKGGCPNILRKINPYTLREPLGIDGSPFMMLTWVSSGAKNLFLIFLRTNPEINQILMMA